MILSYVGINILEVGNLEKYTNALGLERTIIKRAL